MIESNGKRLGRNLALIAISSGPRLKNYLVFAAALGAVAASRWIANFGVVPLFLLAAFLFAPAFFAFLSLLFVVTHVLETIGQLLYNYDSLLDFKFKPYLLPIFHSCVKVFLGFSLIIPSIYAEDFILSRGESMSLKLTGLEKFNVANKEVLSYRFNERDKTLLIRGAKLGSSEILVWKKDSGGTPESHQIFVISKLQEQKFLHLAQFLTSMGLATKVQLPQLKVEGKINELSRFVAFKKIQAQNLELIIDEVTLDAELKKEILADIYQKFFNDYKDSIKCSVLFSEFTCYYPANEAPADTIKRELVNKYQVHFIEHNNQKLKTNYSFRMKLIQLEQMDGEELRLGLEQLNTTLGELIRTPLNKIVEKNAVMLAQKKVQMNTLAEPQGLIRPGSLAEFQIGADVPYTTTSKDGFTQTQWQFAGLKVKITMENLGDKLKINFETELTKPSTESNGAISGNKEKSSVVIDLNSPIQIFQLTLKTEALGTDQMPFLNRIPLLGELFKSKSNQNNYKMISGIIEVNQHE